jgi:hypothetical protein
MEDGKCSRTRSEKKRPRRRTIVSKRLNVRRSLNRPGALRVDDDLLRLEQSYMTLAENEEWLDSNSDKLISE